MNRCIIVLSAASFALVSSLFSPAWSQDPVGQEPGIGSTVRISGRLTDTNGEPIPGATVRAVWGSHMKTGGDAIKESISDQQGHYKIDLEPPLEATRSTAAFVGVRSKTKALVTSFARDASKKKETLMDFSVPDASGLTIRVRDAGGTAVENASLVGVATESDLAPRAYFSETFLSIMGIEVPRTDANGLMRIEWLPPSEKYVVVVQHPDFAREGTIVRPAGDRVADMTLHRGREIAVQIVAGNPKAIEQVETSIRRDEDDWDERIELDAQGRGRFRLKARQGASILVEHPTLVSSPGSQHLYESHREQVYRFELAGKGTVRGRVVDAATDVALAGVRIVVVDPKSNYVVAAGTTDAKGEYNVQCPAVDSQVRVDNDGDWQTEQRFDVSFHGDSNADVPQFEVIAKSPINGTVVDSSGNPAPHVMVTHLWRGEPRMTNEDGEFEFPRSAFSSHGPDGVLAIDLESGQAGVAVVVPPDVAARLSRRPAFLPNRSGKKPNPDAPLVVQLKPTCSVSGQVVGKDGEPVAGALVSLSMSLRHGTRRMRYSNQFLTASDDQGAFQFNGLIDGIAYRADVTAGRGPGQSLFTVKDGLELDPVVFNDDDPIKGQRSSGKDLLNQPAPPELVCQNWFNSDPLTFEQLRGKPVLLNFWGTWCGPCKVKLPMLRTLHDQYHDDGLVVIGVHTGFKYDPVAVKRDIEQYRLRYPIAIDHEGGETVAAYGVVSYPTTMMIDRDGRFLGRVSRQAMLSEISRGIRGP